MPSGQAERLEGPEPIRYEPLALLHKGTLRDVILLRDHELDRLCVGHHLPAGSGDPRAEAERLSRVTHPCMAPFLGFDEASNGWWFMFDYVRGHPLSFQAPPDDLESWAAFWLTKMLQVVDAWHTSKEVLGGFSPGDWVANSDGLFLVDPGTAERLCPEQAARSRDANKQGFFAPEPGPATRAGDLYSAAAVAWWLITGEAPPRSPSDPKKTMQVLLRACPEVQPTVAKVLALMVQVDPSARVPARQALDRLALSVRSRTGESPPQPEATLQVWAAQMSPQTVLLLAEAAAQPPLRELAPLPSPPPSLLRDVTEDVWWSLRDASIKRQASTLVVVVLAGIGLFHLGRSLSVPPPPPPLLQVRSGQVGINHRSDWEPATAISGAGLIRNFSPQATLQFGIDGVVELTAPKTTVRLDHVAADLLSLTLVEGEVRLRLPSGARADVNLPQGQAECPQASSVMIWTDNGRTRFKVYRGTVTLVRPRGTSDTLPEGSTL